MKIASTLRCSTLALGLVAAAVWAGPAFAQSGSTGCYSGAANDQANIAEGCKPGSTAPMNAAPVKAGAGPYSGKEDAAAKGTAQEGGCAPPPGSPTSAQDLSKALAQTNTQYDKDCAAAYKNQQ